MDHQTRAELAHRWAYRAELESMAAARFARLSARMASCGMHPELVALTAAAMEQERNHLQLCSDISARFGVRAELGSTMTAPEIAPPTFQLRDRVVYEIIAFCCITETANAVVVTAGADEIDDPAIRRAVRTILADEIQHSRIGWRFLATHPLGDTERAWIGGYLPDMLAGTVRTDLFKPVPIIGDEHTMQRYGTLPVRDRRQAFLTGMREVVIPGLAEVGVDTAPATQFLDSLELSIDSSIDSSIENAF